MASASSSSARNLFQESKRRLSDRVQTNVNNIGSLAKQILKGSKSNEMLAHSTKNFCQTEGTMESSFNHLQKMQVILAQLNQQEQTVRNSIEKLSEVQEQIRDMQR